MNVNVNSLMHRTLMDQVIKVRCISCNYFHKFNYYDFNNAVDIQAVSS